MKKYNSPEMKIVVYDLDDIITKSPVTDWGDSPYFYSIDDISTFLND